MKFSRIDEYIIPFAKEIIRDALSLKYWDKIFRVFTISCEVAFIDDNGNQYTAKRYGIGNNNMKLIVM
jgi:hypothetical protein